MRNSSSMYAFAHHELNLSTREIAELFDVPKNTVIQILKYHGLLKKALGVETEEKVFTWLKKNSDQPVTRMRGDHEFDLVWGNKTIDVKSTTRPYGYFELRHDTNKVNPDYYLFVFDDMTMYLMPGEYGLQNKSVRVCPHKGKYAPFLEYLGRL